MNSFKEAALSLLYPRVCPVCGQILTKRTAYSENPYICRTCYPKLDFLPGPRCMKCSKPLDDETEQFCADCRRKERSFVTGIALLRHDAAGRRILYDLKYQGLRDNADFIGMEMAGRLGHFLVRWKIDAILPVPLHPRKMRLRGFNQAELAARRMTDFLTAAGRPAPPVDTDYLERAFETAAQKELRPTEREANIAGAFRLKGEPGRYRSVLLIDDIYTTGATLNECAKMLHRSGVDMVYFMAVTIGS